MDQGAEAAVRLARISGDLLMTLDEEATQQSIVVRAVEAVDGCEAAVLSTRTGNRLRTAAATSVVAEACDELQHRRGEGPCVEVDNDGELLLVPDTAMDVRWPAWGRRVAEMGMSSVLAVRLAVAGRRLGTLAFYSSEVDAFDATAVALAFAYATHAALALTIARQAASFAAAKEARHVIGMAQGVLIARYGISGESAFSLLRRHSNSTNTKLRDVARQVVDDGGLPTQHIPRQPTGGHDLRGKAPNVDPRLEEDTG